tara:strand:- start:527 stop:823 length:297 start_codon:yes stop_codon:yes gene_type:complete
MRITSKEKQIIQALEWSDFANEHEPTLQGYIHFDEWNMTVFRGVMASLSMKGIVVWSEAEYVNDHPELGCTWGYINQEYTIIEDAEARMNWDLFEMEA